MIDTTHRSAYSEQGRILHWWPRPWGSHPRWSRRCQRSRSIRPWPWTGGASQACQGRSRRPRCWAWKARRSRDWIGGNNAILSNILANKNSFILRNSKIVKLQFWQPNHPSFLVDVCKAPHWFLVRRPDEVGPHVACVEKDEQEAENAVEEDQVETFVENSL